jgi:hypothetical protein
LTQHSLRSTIDTQFNFNPTKGVFYMANTQDRSERPRDVRTLLQRCMAVGRPAMIWGPPGIGKSELIAEIGAEQNRPVIDMRLLLLDPTDIKGIPYFDPETKTMRWAQPADLPSVVTDREIKHAEKAVASAADGSDEKFDAEDRLNVLLRAREFSKAILFLDEINAAPPNVQAAAYQLILNRRVGEYHLPEGVSIVCAGNRDGDKGVTYRMPSPLANRLVHITMAANFDDWQKWAIGAKVKADVLGFLSHHKQYLYNFDPKSADKAFATPRSWVFVSDLIDDNMPESMNTSLVAGTVGEGLATEFSAHRKIASKMPRAEDVLVGKETKLSVKDLSAMYSLTISMCYTLNEWSEKALKKEDNYDMKEWHKNVDFFFKFMMDNFQVEMIVLGAKYALRDQNLPINHRELKQFKEFHEKFGKYILED